MKNHCKLIVGLCLLAAIGAGVYLFGGGGTPAEKHYSYLISANAPKDFDLNTYSVEPSDIKLEQNIISFTPGVPGGPVCEKLYADYLPTLSYGKIINSGKRDDVNEFTSALNMQAYISARKRGEVDEMGMPRLSEFMRFGESFGFFHDRIVSTSGKNYRYAILAFLAPDMDKEQLQGVLKYLRALEKKHPGTAAIFGVSDVMPRLSADMLLSDWKEKGAAPIHLYPEGSSDADKIKDPVNFVNIRYVEAGPREKFNRLKQAFFPQIYLVELDALDFREMIYYMEDNGNEKYPWPKGLSKKRVYNDLMVKYRLHGTPALYVSDTADMDMILSNIEKGKISKNDRLDKLMGELDKAVAELNKEGDSSVYTYKFNGNRDPYAILRELGVIDANNKVVK